MSATVERDSRWRSNRPMRVQGDPPAKVTEAVVTRIDGRSVSLRVTRGHGARRRRTYVQTAADLLANWTRIA